MMETKNISDILFKKYIPFIGLLDLTYKCNLNCRHCCIVQEERDELSTEELISVLDQLHDMNTFVLVFSGGEALLRSDIFDILYHARRLNYRINLYTNGTLIDSKKADEIKRLRIDNVGISLYGVTDSVHDKITGVPGSFAATIRAIKLLKERKINITLKSTIMQINFNELDALHCWSKDRKIFHEFSFMIVPHIDQTKDNLQLRLTDEQCKAFLKKPWTYQFAQNRLGKIKSSDKENLCGAGTQSFNISPYGDIHPCAYLRIVAGNLREKSFSELWNTSIMKKIRDSTLNDLRECSSCELLGKWCSVCPGLSWLEHGDWLGPAYENCRKARFRKEIYGSIEK